jgi:phage terminase large subunit
LSILKIETPRVFKPLLQPSRYKGAHGGRGSGKSHFFAEKLVEDCLEEKGMLAVCIREVQKSLMQSSKRLLEAKIAALGVGHLFKVFEREIQTPGDGVIIFQGMAEQSMYADFGIENGTPIIRVSEAKNGFTSTLLATMAHEMCHLRQQRLGDRGHHSASFKRMAARVCRAHGFDLKTF